MAHQSNPERTGHFQALNTQHSKFNNSFSELLYYCLFRKPGGRFLKAQSAKKDDFINMKNTGDKSGAEAPDPSGFPISFNKFTNVLISEFIKLFRIFLFRSSWVTKG